MIASVLASGSQSILGKIWIVVSPAWITPTNCVACSLLRSSRINSLPELWFKRSRVAKNGSLAVMPSAWKETACRSKIVINLCIMISHPTPPTPAVTSDAERPHTSGLPSLSANGKSPQRNPRRGLIWGRECSATRRSETVETGVVVIQFGADLGTVDFYNLVKVMTMVHHAIGFVIVSKTFNQSISPSDGGDHKSCIDLIVFRKSVSSSHHSHGR